MLTASIKNIAWKVSSLSPDLASVRYRAILPLLSLNALGIKSELFSSYKDITISDFDVLVIVKSFTPDDLYLAQQASKSGVKVFFDLCDNIFIDGYKGKLAVTPADFFKATLPFLSGITVTTNALQNVVNEITQGSVTCFVIPDGIETKKEFGAAKKLLGLAVKQSIHRDFSSFFEKIKKIGDFNVAVLDIDVKMKLLRSEIKSYLKPIRWVKQLYAAYDCSRAKITGLPRKVKRPILFIPNEIYFNGKKISKREVPSGLKKVIWFGNHGANYADFGITDLLLWRDSLEKVHKKIPLELIVVSNNRERFTKFISPFKCVTRYVEWSATAVENILPNVHATLIPNSKDPFSVCKSANRTVLSLNVGIPVVATLTPGLKELESVIYCGNPYENLMDCLMESKNTQEKLRKSKKIIRECFGPATIRHAALNAFTNAKASNIKKLDSSKIVIALNLIQDFEMAKPLVDALKAQGRSYAVWVSFSLAKKSRKVLGWLTQDEIPYFCLPDDQASSVKALYLEYGVESFLTMAETNLGPHKFTNTLTQVANEMGIKTFTFQHGYENIGITYSDEIHNIKKIDIAANHILTWGASETFHPDIKPDIQSKIIPVGCLKPATALEQIPTLLDERQGVIVGVFENLHWHRYSKAYQELFMDSLDKASVEFPNVTFFIKPHPAGMWLTSRYKGELPSQANIIIANPEDPKWDEPLLNDYLRRLDAVISTPSTVVLDSARAGLPTLVCGFDLKLEKFSSLKIASETQDWLDFVSQIVNGNTSQLKEHNRDFVSNAILNNDAISATLKLLSA